MAELTRGDPGTAGGVLGVVGPAAAAAARSTGRVRTWIVAVVAVAVYAGAVWFGVGGRDFRTWDFRDFDVYRAGAEAVLRGAPVYSAHAPGSDLLFTYPPFAALVFVPLELGVAGVARLLLTVISLGAAVVIAYATLRGVGRPAGWRTGWWALALAGLTLRSQPFSQTLHLGQVNLVVVAMVLGDLVLVSAPRRGWLLGVAAGFKPTPLVLVGYLVLSRQWRAAAQAVVGFAATVAVGFVVLPATARLYWGTEVTDTARIGALSYVANQSLTGLLGRATDDPDPSSRGTVVLAVVVLAVGAGVVGWWLWGPDRRGDRRGSRTRSFEALCLAAVAGLLASPVSWTHHWVWCLPVAAALVRRLAQVRHDRALWGWGTATVLWVVVFWTGPMWHTPRGGDLEFTDTWWQAIAADSYTLLGIALLAAALVHLAWPVAYPFLKPRLTPVRRVTDLGR